MIWRRRKPLATRSDGSFLISLRCESVAHDGVGWMATFSGKPTVAGNSLTFPVDDRAARSLKPGAEYVVPVTPTGRGR